jgi:DNA-binding beta-propeller fold protein YncE
MERRNLGRSVLPQRRLQNEANRHHVCEAIFVSAKRRSMGDESMATNKSSFRTLRKAYWPLAIYLTAMLLLCTAWGLRRNELNAPNTEQQNQTQIDITKLQWPAAPAVARIQMLAEFSGEKEGPRPVPVKRSWIDRMSNIQPALPARKPATPLVSPYGVAADSKGRIYVADASAHAIAIFDQDGTHVLWYRDGVQARFANIVGLAIDRNDRLFVTDADLRSVTVIAPTGDREAIFGGQYLARPAGAAMDSERGLLYVADTERECIAVFEADTYKYLRCIGAPSKVKGNNQPGTLSKPTNVAVGEADGAVYVSDTLNGRIQLFTSEGEFIGTLGEDALNTLRRPKGIAVDCDGHIWVADATLNRVQVFDRQGHLLAYFGQFGRLPAQFIAAAGLFIDSRNRVIVSDQGSKRVQVFRYIPDSEAAILRANQNNQPDGKVMASN